MHTMNAIATGHDDIVHDVAYDAYGRLLATCSSDHWIRIFSRKQSNQPWTPQSGFNAHDAAVFSVAFAPPQYGVVIASCSEDQSARIHTSADDGVTFDRLATLSDSVGAVHCVAFAIAPAAGLRLACIGTDGVVRVYHAADPADLRMWHLGFQQVVDPSQRRSGAYAAAKDMQGDFSLAWCPSAVFTLPSSPLTSDEQQNEMVDEVSVIERPVDQFVVSSMSYVCVFRRRGLRAYDYAPREELPGHTDIVHDVAWASSAGVAGRYELIATACRDGYVRIFKLTPRRSAISSDGDAAPEEDMAYDVALLDQFDDHKSEVWKVSFNASGSVLSSSGDDGRVRFWRPTYSGRFVSLGVVSAEQQAMPEDEMED
ncbi:WD40-repeat-containing domain protein [Limtongia smithiae]|uniref:WD40-repeat-containing domain protein n=1 Tax=Limtongia smithiae TaxID=1125753 RepID=UPI0034CE52E2